jgi:hypothetical protein
MRDREAVLARCKPCVAFVLVLVQRRIRVRATGSRNGGNSHLGGWACCPRHGEHVDVHAISNGNVTC